VPSLAVLTVEVSQSCNDIEVDMEL